MGGVYVIYVLIRWLYVYHLSTTIYNPLCILAKGEYNKFTIGFDHWFGETKMKNVVLIIITCLLSLAILLPACNGDLEQEEIVTSTEQPLETEATSSEQEETTTTTEPTPEIEPINSEREEIIGFTQQALEIETRRNELNIYISERASRFEVGLPGAKWFRNLCFLDGYSKDHTLYRQGDPELEGMTSLRKRLLFLDCPQSMQVIKDILNDIYSSEVELAERQIQGEEYPEGVPFFGNMLVLTEVDQHNIELWIEEYKSWQFMASSSTLLMNHPWVELQLLRRDVYTRWAEILLEHGIDPVEEGFTELK